MNIEEFNTAVAADEKLISEGKTPKGMQSCSKCKVPLQSFITGREFLGDGSQVCSDCYWEMMGEEIEVHPISALRSTRRFGRRNLKIGD